MKKKKPVKRRKKRTMKEFVLGTGNPNLKSPLSSVALEELIITITLPKSRVERICHRIDDLLCWAEGFKAASHGNYHLEPFDRGINGVRDIHDHLKIKLG